MSRNVSRELMAALADVLGPIDDLTNRTREWSSATFTGTQHQLEFSVSDGEAIAGLAEAELPMKGHFVADLRIVSLSRSGNRGRLVLEVLTIAEA